MKQYLVMAAVALVVVVIYNYAAKKIAEKKAADGMPPAAPKA